MAPNWRTLKGVIEIPRPGVRKGEMFLAFIGSEKRCGILRSPALRDGALRRKIGVPMGYLGWIVPE